MRNTYALLKSFQHTAARRRLDAAPYGKQVAKLVSTHSRPKAAGYEFSNLHHFIRGFNTQPPEGGWASSKPPVVQATMFQHTAARRRLVNLRVFMLAQLFVSTHSRPKAAGCFRLCRFLCFAGFNTQPPEGGWERRQLIILE